MKVAILGAGNAGSAVACDLTLKGHEVTLIKTSNSLHNDHFNFLKENGGVIRLIDGGEDRTGKLHKVSEDLSDAEDADVVIIYIQTNYHESLIKRLAPHLHDGQIVIINPGYFSTAYMLKHVKADITVVEATSSFIDCRISEPGTIKVGFRNVRNPIGVYPYERTAETCEKLKSFDFHFYPFSTVEVALHNPNLIVHTVGAIMSIPRIEKTNGDYCMYWEVFTPSVWNILEKLDSEKMDVLEHLGIPRVPYVEACKFRNTLDDDTPAKDIFFWYASMPTRAKGPTQVDHRYITEDVPQGLVMLEAFGKHFNIPTPVCTALIEMANAALKRDFRENGRTLESLGEENIEKIVNNFMAGKNAERA